MQCKAKPISVLVVGLRVREKYRDKENHIISLTSKAANGDSHAMQVSQSYNQD